MFVRYIHSILYIIHLFTLPCCNQLHENTPASVSFLLCVDSWYLSSVGISQMMLLWISGKCLLAHISVLPVGYMPRSRITDTFFTFSRWGESIFPSLRTNLYSHQQCLKVSVTSHLCQPLALSVFFIFSLLVAKSWAVVPACVCLLGHTLTPGA